MPCLKLWIETLRVVHGAKLKLKMALLGFFADQNLLHGLSFFKPFVQHLTTISVRCYESPKCIKMLHIYQAMLSVLSSVVSESQTIFLGHMILCASTQVFQGAELEISGLVS